MSNKKLFEIREIKGGLIAILLLGVMLVCGLLIVAFVKNERGFLQFHGDSQYVPMNEPNKGLYGRINSALERALNEREFRADLLTDAVYMQGSRLHFYVPQTTEHIVDVREIRLIGFTPDSLDIEEVRFFHNSAFKHYLRLQNENINKRYFEIEWEGDRYPPRIKNITVNNTLGNVPLLNNNWRGQILLEDPFSQIDNNVVYLIRNNVPIPLFSSNFRIEAFRGGRTLNDNTTIRVNEWKPNIIHNYRQWYNHLNNYRPTYSEVLRIKYDSIHWVEFLNQGDSIYLTNGTPHPISIWINNRKDTIRSGVNGYPFPRSFRNKVRLEIRNIGNIYLSQTAFSIASKMANDGFAGKRIHISRDYSDLSVRQILFHLENNLDNTINQDITLTNNIILSKLLEDEIRNYINTNLLPKSIGTDDEFQMSITLMDISTGEIIAAPFYSNRFSHRRAVAETERRNFNLIQHHIASAFKPLLAFTAVAKYPNLRDFRLFNFRFIDENNSYLIGYNITPSYGHRNGMRIPTFWPPQGVRQEIDMRHFLGHSHNNYPIALTLLALTEPGNVGYTGDAKVYNLLNAPRLDNAALNDLPRLLRGDSLARVPNDFRFGRVRLGESSFANLFYNLFNVEMDARGRGWELTTDATPWRHLKGNTRRLWSLEPDITNLQLERINDFIDFQNFVIGQGNNYWNNIKLAEAYSRLLSRKAVQATFLKGEDDFPDLFRDNGMFNNVSQINFQRTKQEMESAWLSFMQDWRAATRLEGGTLRSAYLSFRNSFRGFNNFNFNDYYFYAKTGTPQVYNITRSRVDGIRYLTETLWRDEGLFVFGITNRDTANPKGIVGVVYINRLSVDRPTPPRNITSADARDFLTPEIFRTIMFYNKNRFR